MRFRHASQPGRSHVLGGGWIRDKQHQCPWRDYGAYALVYLVSGTGFFQDEDQDSVAVDQGALMHLFPGRRHTYGPEAGGAWTEVWLGFTGPIFAALETDGVLDRRRSVRRPGLHPGIITRFEAIIADLGSGVSDARRVAAVHDLLIHLDEAIHHDEDHPLAEIQAHLLSDLRQPIDLVAIAADLGWSYDTLRRRWQRRHGISPGRWRLLRRLDVVKTLLAEGATLETAAEATGFCDRSFLARKFREEVGMTPGRWRAHILGR